MHQTEYADNLTILVIQIPRRWGDKSFRVGTFTKQTVWLQALNVTQRTQIKGRQLQVQYIRVIASRSCENIAPIPILHASSSKYSSNNPEFRVRRLVPWLTRG